MVSKVVKVENHFMLFVANQQGARAQVMASYCGPMQLLAGFCMWNHATLCSQLLVQVLPCTLQTACKLSPTGTAGGGAPASLLHVGSLAEGSLADKKDLDWPVCLFKACLLVWIEAGMFEGPRKAQGRLLSLSDTPEHDKRWTLNKVQISVGSAP